MTRTHGRIATLHGQSKTSDITSSKVLNLHSIPSASNLPLEDLGKWNKGGALLPEVGSSCGGDLLACWDSQHVYLAVMGQRFVDPKVYANEEIASSELLQFCVTGSARGEPMSIQYGHGNVTRTNGNVKHRLSQSGMRYTLLAAFPAATFGKQRLVAGEKIELRAALSDPRDDAESIWNAELRLQ
jgi:hypothetical protein